LSKLDLKQAEETKKFISELNDQDAAQLMAALGEENLSPPYLRFLECLGG
jgi:hypothetical protein